MGNLIDQDANPKIQYRDGINDKIGLSGAQNFGTVPSGMQLPMGASNPYKDLDTKYTGMFWTEDGKPDKAKILQMALLNQHEKLEKTGKKCLTLTELEAINDNNDQERHPRNCAKMNANMDEKGQRTPYFDGGLTKMNKAGKFPYMSTRNNNFSNRNMMGALCVAEGTTGKCAAGESCQRSMEKELLARYKNESPDGTAKKGGKIALPGVGGTASVPILAESKEQKLARLRAVQLQAHQALLQTQQDIDLLEKA